MRPSLLDYLRCPTCGHRLTSPAPDQLQCGNCARTYPIRSGAPRFVGDATDTAVYFGYMWGQQEALVSPPRQAVPYHLEVMRDALGRPALEGLILDAGCGEGLDLAMLALDPRCEVIGVELSSGGVATSLARTRGMDRAHVVQGDLLSIPMASGMFDGAYSYGVVHHTPDPGGAVREIARTLKPGAPLLLYVYEDFADRQWYWRAALALANSVRVVTTKMPPWLLMAICKLLSPVVWLLCTLPARHFRWAARFPYRHGTHPWSMSGDLYDRLSAPIEKRYSRRGAAALAEAAGLTVLSVAQQRGWMVHARKATE
jgi:SAM-dependent methyltransferase